MRVHVHGEKAFDCVMKSHTLKAGPRGAGNDSSERKGREKKQKANERKRESK